MAWISDLAGKAENLLNKLDSEAATVLADTQIKRKKSLGSRKEHSTSRNDRGGLPSSASVPGNLNSYKGASYSISSSDPQHTVKSSSSASTPSHHSTITSYSAHYDTRGFGQSSSSQNSHSRQSSASSMPGRIMEPDSTSSAPAYTALSMELERDNSSNGSECSSGQLVSFVKVEATDLAISPPLSTTSSDSHSREQTLSEMSEADLLKKEVLSLNQEMTQLLNRTKQAEREVQALRSAQISGSSQQQATEKLLRELQQRELDLQEVVGAKDSQIAVLRVRLQEKDGEASERNKLLEKLKTENASLCEGASVSSGLHSHALQTAQDKLQELQSALDREKNLHRCTIEANTERVRQLEIDQKELVNQAREAQNKLQLESEKQVALANQVANLKSEVLATREEFESYKTRATGILQSKEEIIDKLKQGLGANDDEHSDLMASELNQARVELKLSRDELTKTVEKLNRSRAELSELERIQELEAATHMTALTELQEDYNEMCRLKEELQQENKQIKEELRCVQEESSRLKISHTSQLQNRMLEIEKLQQQICLKKNSGSSTEELENKVKGLTETVIQKQNVIERLNTNLQASNLQLQRLQKQYDDCQSMLNRDTSPSFASVDDVRQRVPSFLVESPFDRGLTRRVKRAYSTVDRLSLGMGLLLRRHPVARISVLLYMVLLHLWVLLVLLTYSPEIHPPDYDDLNRHQHPPMPN